jgi:UDP-3-O-[3-hydroxymyristoyl] N-acetylglucosamine deacetylase
VFVREVQGRQVLLQALTHNLVPSELCTTLRVDGIEVKTVEHVLSALVGLDIDNVYVCVDGAEVPVMDGSAAPFVRMIQAAGIVPQDQRQAYLKIIQPIELIQGNRRVVIEPSPVTKVSYSIVYNHPLIQTQRYEYQHSAEAFASGIAESRTFGFLKEVEGLWARGLAKGGSLDNTVVLSETGLMNNSGLRFEDEFVRHKVLDLLGDFALLGIPFIGHVIAERSGHALHTNLVQQILAQPDKWVLIGGNSHQSILSHSTSPQLVSA